MKKKILLFFLIFLFSIYFANGGDENMKNEWKLVWVEEFEGDTLNTDIWKFDIGNGHSRWNPGWGNGELEYYTEGKNMYLENGMLVIEARKEKVKDAYGEYYYTSTRINTENKFKVKYGKIEARAKFPYGKGLWPAIWLLGSNFRYVGWPMCGEIDIVEFLGHDRYTVYGTIHGPGYSKDKAKSWKYRLDMDEPDFTEEFHRFGIIWDDKKISFYVDDTVYYTVKKEVILKQGYPWVFDNEFFLIVNLAVGGYWPGYPDNTTKFPARMYVDYIKVWQKVE